MEQVDEYRRLLDEQSRLKELEKENTEKIQAQRETLANLMVESETPKISRSGYTYSLSVKTKYSKKAGCDEMLFKALRGAGLGDLIKETVNANTLQGALGSLCEEYGGLPEAFEDCVGVYEMMDVVRRKDSGKINYRR